jgi:hypothetical protein
VSTPYSRKRSYNRDRHDQRDVRGAHRGGVLSGDGLTQLHFASHTRREVLEGCGQRASAGLAEQQRGGHVIPNRVGQATSGALLTGFPPRMGRVGTNHQSASNHRLRASSAVAASSPITPSGPVSAEGGLCRRHTVETVHVTATGRPSTPVAPRSSAAPTGLRGVRCCLPGRRFH